MNKIIISISTILYLTSAFIGLYYLKRFPRTGLIFITTGLLLMALKGVLNLFGVTPIEPAPYLTLVISLFLFFGIIFLPYFFKEHEKALNFLKGLWEMDRIILSGLTPKSIITGIKNVINKLVDCDALAIYIVEKDGKKLSPYTNFNLSEEFHKEVIAKEDNIIWKTINERKTILIKDAKYDKDFLKTLNKHNFSTFIGIPLIIRGTPFGVLMLLSYKKSYHRKEIKYIEGVSRQIAIAMDRIRTIEHVKEINIESVFALVQAIEMRDPCTKGHSLQVANIAVELLKVFDKSERELELIRYAGLLHDVGKIAVPEAILNKPSSLDEVEWQVMKKHPVKSAEIIKPIKGLQEIEEWIRYHHERWDGSGYPDGLKGTEIPFFSRILAICDTYSAMVSDRPYRKGLTDEEAREEIKRCSGKQFDPEVVEVFLLLSKEFLKNLIEKTGASS